MSIYVLRLELLERECWAIMMLFDHQLHQIRRNIPNLLRNAVKSKMWNFHLDFGGNRPRYRRKFHRFLLRPWRRCAALLRIWRELSSPLQQLFDGRSRCRRLRSAPTIGLLFTYIIYHKKKRLYK